MFGSITSRRKLRPPGVVLGLGEAHKKIIGICDCGKKTIGMGNKCPQCFLHSPSNNTPISFNVVTSDTTLLTIEHLLQ